MTLADCTVMVVEDHEFQRRTMLQILANLGTGRLLEAADGESALALLAAEPRPDVVVCDLDMPGMDGVEFLRHVSERSIDTAIVIASGLGEGVLRAAETTARAYGLDVLGAVGKPLTARRLLEIVGLHRPAAPAARVNGAETDAWMRALATGTAEVVLSPRIDLLSGDVAGIAAHAVRLGATGPLPAATDLAADAPSAVAARVAELALDGACAALRDRPDLDATVLIPAAACADLTLAERFAARTAAAGVAPSRLCVAVPRDLRPSVVQLDVLTRLLVRGFGVGVDRFAGGDVPLGGIALTEVALAPEAVAGAEAEALEATVRSLHARGVRVVATGSAERDLLAQAGCDRAEP